MPKIKTAKSVLKRIERTGSGALRVRKMSVAHRALFKSKRALQAVGKKYTLSNGIAKKIKKIVTV